MRRASLLAALAALVLPTAPALAQGAESCAVTKTTDIGVPMRDGTTLSADVYRPQVPAGREVPVILMRLPYDKAAAQRYVYEPPEFYARHCYLVVIQDVRGQYGSEGVFYPFRDEARDGYDSVEWAARLPGSNGRVGMYGFSYVGATQWLAATQRPPHLKAISPAMTSSDYYDGWTYQDGAFSLAFAESWPITTIARSAAARRPGGAALVEEFDRQTPALKDAWYWYLPLDRFPLLGPDSRRIAPYFYDWLEHPTNDAYWQRWSIRRRYERIEVPALNVDGWYDVFLNGAIENFVGMRHRGATAAARRGQKLVIGPWIHLPWSRKAGQVDFGPEAESPVDAMQLRFFDHHLKGIANGVDREPAVRVFVMGANRWRTADDWPIPGTRFTNFYLRSGGSANSRSGDGRLSTRRPRASGEAGRDRFTYDPRRPVPSVGGHSCCEPDVAPVGPYDQRWVEQRPDVLVYDTERLERPVEVTGPITVTLYASSSAPNTDFTAKLVDVDRRGRAINLNDGIIRASHRRSEVHPRPIRPGRVYRYDIEVWPTSNLFRRGHRIRLEISSSNFPMYDRNPNTGHPFAEDAELRSARQVVLHDPEHPSRIRLPIVRAPLDR
jgi:putative CocE/NonD family hydrolase